MSKKGITIRHKAIVLYCKGESTSSICKKLKVPRSTFYLWIHNAGKHPADLHQQSMLSNISRNMELMQLKEKLEKQSQIYQVLLKAKSNPSSSLKDKLEDIDRLHGEFTVHALSAALNVPRSTIYNHFQHQGVSDYNKNRREMMMKEIQTAYDENHQIFGPIKIREILVSKGIKVSRRLVTELMREMNLFSIRKSAKTIYDRENARHIDRVNMEFDVKAPNKVWVSDFTFYESRRMTFFICIIMDLFSRKILSWSLSRKQSTQLLSRAFLKAIQSRKPKAGLIFHSDRGCQYTSRRFAAMCREEQIIQSFSPSGNPYHNSVMESFNSSLKQEELYRGHYKSDKDMAISIGKYILFYNEKRPHGANHYRTPNQVEREFFRSISILKASDFCSVAVRA